MVLDTIFAPASGIGKSAVSVVRISGPQTGQSVRHLTGKDLPEPRKATLVTLSDPVSGQMLDRGLVLWFPGPASFTGEDMAEIHLHGGTAVLERLLQVLCDEKGLRLADGGEFTRRAFDNGKMDLTEVEGLADLLAAQTEGQRLQALRQMSGALGALYGGWRDRLLKSLAYLEAEIDFSDQDLPVDLSQSMSGDVRATAADIENHLNDRSCGEKLRDGFHVTILGAPNVGKSSILNALASRDVSIVSSLAGTTRDILESYLDIDGLPITFADTAGLQDSGDEIEAEGIRRARERAGVSDLVLLVVSPDQPSSLDVVVEAPLSPQTIVILNKSDLLGNYPEFEAEVARCFSQRFDNGISPALLKVSALAGEGLGALLETVCVALGREDMAISAAAPALTRARHRQQLELCLEALHSYLAALGTGPEAPAAFTPEILAEDLRAAVHHLSVIVGFVGVEDVLGVIFQEFCIGK